MTDKKDDGSTDNRNLWAIMFAVGVSIFVIMVANVLVLNHLYVKPEDRGTAGDQFGGVTALFSGLAFAGLIITLYIQRKELELQRNELRASNKEFALQRFDSGFFGVVRMLNDQVSSINIGNLNGRAALEKISELLRQDCQSGGLSLIKNMDEETFLYTKDDISSLFEARDAQLGPYFRILHNIYRLIDSEKELSPKQKADYARIARAHISLAELDIIFLNGLTFQAEKFLPLIERYAILKHTSFKTREHYRVINDRYDPSAFAGRTLPLPTATKSVFPSRQ